MSYYALNGEPLTEEWSIDMNNVELAVSIPPRIISTTTSSKQKPEPSETEHKRRRVANQDKDDYESSKQVVPAVPRETWCLPDPCVPTETRVFQILVPYQIHFHGLHVRPSNRDNLLET